MFVDRNRTTSMLKTVVNEVTVSQTATTSGDQDRFRLAVCPQLKSFPELSSFSCEKLVVKNIARKMFK
ncbi:hypothetical protein X777_00845 [Ooceraea biroi]|uniref:Uncharacterized protein n=1 Tax=Ooceraea biroi TaxID=2015173 RepID=A0A026WP03_OOCBI|nr:hypothetical protein X777_00845 [Ooceraea biroi]